MCSSSESVPLKSNRRARTGTAAQSTIAGMRVEETIELLWPGSEAVVTVLGGGITNHNYKVEVGGEAFVLRIGGKDTELLGIDRDHEHAASLVAASLGVGPAVVAFVDGCLVTRFIE